MAARRPRAAANSLTHLCCRRACIAGWACCIPPSPRSPALRMRLRGPRKHTPRAWPWSKTGEGVPGPRPASAGFAPRPRPGRAVFPAAVDARTRARLASFEPAAEGHLRLSQPYKCPTCTCTAGATASCSCTGSGRGCVAGPTSRRRRRRRGRWDRPWRSTWWRRRPLMATLSPARRPRAVRAQSMPYSCGTPEPDCA